LAHIDDIMLCAVFPARVRAASYDFSAYPEMGVLVREVLRATPLFQTMHRYILSRQHHKIDDDYYGA
jgi:hypothetical protein